MSNKKYCMSCFNKLKESEDVCPLCKFSNTTPQVDHALKYNTKLQNKYLIGKNIDSNSEGFTYSGFDTFEEKRVVVREFFPRRLSTRDEKTMTITPKENAAEVFDRFFNLFLTMAKGLISLKPYQAIVSVIDMFWENNTAYIIYEYIKGDTLREYVRKKGGKLEWNKAVKMFSDMIDSLSAMHGKGVKHLGISPDTIIVTEDDKIVLTQFCTEPVRRVNALIEPDLVLGAAAYEQHVRTLECNEITDVYGFCASLIFALTGELPPSAEHRVQNAKLMISKEILNSMPRPTILAIATGLQVEQRNRTSSFKRLKAELLSEAPIVEQAIEVRAIRDIPQGKRSSAKQKVSSPGLWMATSFAVTAVVLFVVFYYIINTGTFTIGHVTDAIDDAMFVSADETIIVPDMVGGYYEDWVSDVARNQVYDFKLVIEEQVFSDEITAGKIVSQKPVANGDVVKGGEVLLVVSLGTEIKTLPTIKGKKFSEVLVTLEDLGFVVVQEDVAHGSVPAGAVIDYKDENHYAGAELSYGSTVTVEVSIGG